MATRFSLFSLLFLFFAKFSEAVDFTCPTDPIFRQSGTFPKDSLTLVTFPNNYNCDIKFQIEDGFIYKLTIVTNVTGGSGDSFVVTNTLGKQTNYTEGVTLLFVPAKSATISIKSGPGTSQFWFRYEHTYVGLIEQNRIPTGSYLNLFITSLKTYTYVSPYNDKVVINTATIDNINQVDEKLKMIFVYDGMDVYSPFVGNLYDVVTTPNLMVSTGNATTLANFYGTPTNSYALANDFKSISAYETYNFIVYTKNVTIPKNFQDGISNAYTFYCPRADRVYLTDLDFGSNSFKMDLRSLTPSDQPHFYLEYKATGPYARSLPQMIPGRLFTVISLGPELTFTLSTTTDNWLTPYNGRRGIVFSDSLWNPGAKSGYNYTFESTELMTFTFNFQSAIIHQAGEQVQVKVGRPGAVPVSVTFDHSIANPGVRVANGTYLTTSCLGNSPLSSSIITFEMFNADGTLPTTTSSATTITVETTTKVGSRSGYVLIVALFFIFIKLF